MEHPDRYPQVARVQQLRLERNRQFVLCWLSLELWKRLARDGFFILRLGRWQMPARTELRSALLEIGFQRETNPLQEIHKDSLAAAKARKPSARFDCGQLDYS